MATGPATRAAGQATGALGGVLLLVAAALPWSGRGAGSALALHRVGDLVLSGAVDAWVPRWAGLAVYAVPLGGAALLVAAGLGGRAGAVVAVGAVVAAAAGAAVVLVALDRVGRTGTGAGALVAGAGLALGVAAAVLARPAPPSHPADGEGRTPGV